MGNVQQDRAHQIARSILTGFDRHYSYFQEITSSARQRFRTSRLGIGTGGLRQAHQFL
jgi:isocitrate dehydrogenase kinase/phosphatase